MAKSISDAVSKIYELLEPLKSDERGRVVAAVTAMLGDGGSSQQQASTPSPEFTKAPPDSASTTLPIAANAWLQRNQISQNTLDKYFDFNGSAVTAIKLPTPQASKKDNTLNAYLLQGVAALFSTGVAEFTDDDARELCTRFGCYDSTNHAKYTKDFGSRFTGSKSTGWRLTVPGLTAAADLIKSQG